MRGIRCMSASASAAGKNKGMMVFDTNLKRLQRAGSTRRNLEEYSPRYFDYLREEIAERLVDRLQDIKRDFSQGHAVDIGSLTGSMARALLKSPIQPKSLLQCASSAEMLQRNLDESIHLANSSSTQLYSVLCDEESLPLPSRKFDLAVSCLSLQWVNNLPLALKTIRRSLKPDGCFVAALIGGDSLQELRSAFALADQERRGGLSPHVSPMTKLRDCGSLLQEAGFVLPTLDIDSVVCPYPDAFTAMHHLQGMGEGNAALARDAFVSRDVFAATAAIYQEMYGTEDGLVPATFEVIYVIGWAPSASQKQAMPRGSAEASLKDLI